MRHVLVQDNAEEAFAHNQLEVIQNRDSHYWNGTYSLQGAFIRNNTNVKVEGENAETHLFGLYLPMGKSQIDNHTSIDHKVPNCFSNELYKGVVGDSATGVFNGKVFVRQDAQKVNAFQSNRNILLSDTATLNTKPQLEIWADDVKCSHGATSGQLSEEELFYLQSRGISKEKARSILVYAFAAETIEAVHDDSLKEFLLTKLQRQLNFEV